MSENDTVIKVENVSKQYRLGTVGTGTLSHDLNRWWANIRGKEDPTLKLGEANDRTLSGDSEYAWALKDINFDVKQGEVLGIIGRNGAGKSTLLKLLSRVTGPTTGEIKVKGRLASLLEVGTGFHPELTGRENIYLNGAIMGMTKAEIHSKLDEIVDFSGCERYLDTPVKRYSSGMTVRLGFAVAAHLEPEVLIVDEVLAVGDAEFQKKCIGKMKDVSGEGRTVLFVSHNMASIQKLCNNVLILDNGLIKSYSDTTTGIQKYIALNKKKSVIKVKDRIDRKSSEIFKFIDVKLINSKGEQIDNIKSGDDLSLRLDYKSSSVLKNIVGRIVVKGNDGQELCTLNNYHCDHPFSEIPLNGYMKCSLKNIPFFSGQYTIDISCLMDLKTIDSVEDAFTFDIQDSDFYGTGKIPINKKGIMLHNSWECIPC